jgi:RNA-directed DNA polymerase
MTLLKKITHELGLPISDVRTIARTASHAYKVYQIQKRDGGFRQIHHPSKRLKALQRWLLQNVISAWPVHESAKAYRQRINIRDNAREHISSKYLLRMDFLDFFHSISRGDVLSYLDTDKPSNARDWDSADKGMLADLVCCGNFLTIGAPSSPAISNALCFDLDRKLDGLAHANSARYTRYADDLFFSTRFPDILKSIPSQVESIVNQLPLPSNLKVNPSKTRHSSKKTRRQVTGLVLTSDDTVGIGRQRKRYIRSLLFKYDTLNDDQKSSLAGLLSFAKSIDPDFINALVIKYGHSLVAQARRPFN